MRDPGASGIRPAVAGLSCGCLLLIALASCGSVAPDYSDLPQKSLDEVYPESVRFHVVKRGETLTQIAREREVDIPSILKRNPGMDPDKIQPGQRIVLPPRSRR
ncbi:MAG: LysM domain-containing protein [Planctomycetota bacterium]|nr:LysM domain-containing protein [Planctomycetota bacterium]